MSSVQRLKPSNRHILIVPHEKENQTQTGVFLPEDYEPEKSRYIEATVIDVADDCNESFRRLKFGAIQDGKKILVDRSMIQEVSVSDRKHFLILENYVLGFYVSP